MDVNSIVDRIVHSVTASYTGKIEVKDNSFLLDLLKDDNDESSRQDKQDKRESKPFDIVVPWKKKDENHRFPITYYIFSLLILIVKVLIWLIYWGVGKIRCLFFKNNKSVSDLSVSPRFNFLLFASVIICYLVAICYIFVFFLKSVLFFRPDISMNEHGAIIIPQPCNVEHYVYMFNAAECWANTGIKVLEGDEVEIAASGAFYGNISQLDSCARENSKPPYSHINIATESRTTESIMKELVMYKDSIDATFGSLLLQIKEDWEEPSYNSKDKSKREIHQLNYVDKKGIKPIVVETAGVLCFAVNDIYFTDDVFTRIHENTNLQKNLEIETVTLIDTITSKKIKKRLNDIPRDSLAYYIKRDMWFCDNVGEILLNITVTRNDISETESMPSFLVKQYRRMENKLLSLSKWEILCHIVLYVLIITLWLFIDHVIGYIIRTKKQHRNKNIA